MRPGKISTAVLPALLQPIRIDENTNDSKGVSVNRITAEEAAQLHSPTLRIPTEPDNFVMGLDVFHQLHCLVSSPAHSQRTRRQPTNVPRKERRAKTALSRVLRQLNRDASFATPRRLV